MALPTSGPLSLLQICAEFGAPAGTRLTQLVRGGAFVPDTAANAGVPAAPPISLRDFLGATNTSPVALSDHTVLANQYPEPNPSPPPAVTYDVAIATFQLNAAGTAHGIRTTGEGAVDTDNTAYPGEWKLGGASADYEAMATLSSGTIDSGDATGVWLNLGTTRSWSHRHTGPGSSSAVLVVSIRPAGGGATLASATITLTGSR